MQHHQKVSSHAELQHEIRYWIIIKEIPTTALFGKGLVSVSWFQKISAWVGRMKIFQQAYNKVRNTTAPFITFSFRTNPTAYHTTINATCSTYSTAWSKVGLHLLQLRIKIHELFISRYIFACNRHIYKQPLNRDRGTLSKIYDHIINS